MQRNLTGVAGIILSLVAFGTSAYHIYTGFFGQPEAYLHRVIHVTLMMLITFMSYSAFSRADDGKVPWYDVVVIGLWFVTMGYLFYEYDWIIEHIGYTEEFAPFQLILAFGAVALTLEACRRAIGWPLAALALLIFLFAFTGPYLPGFLNHLGYTASEVADNLYFLTDGLFGLPTHISANFIFLFIVFGAFLEKSGFGLFTIEFATALAGRFRGGPAKIAVVASGLMGSISGSSTANAVITGSFSIPMMKKIGFKDYMAGAVEASASTGGLIMPPVMASAGFLMSEYTGIPYVNVMQYVLVPAVLYFLAVGIMVHIYAVKENIPTVPREELPSLKKAIMARGHLALPLIILIYLLVAGFSPGYAVVRCIVGIVIVSWLRKATRMGLRDIWDALVQGGIQSTVVAVAIITSGIMVGIFDLTGVAIKFSGVIVDLAGGHLLLALVFVMITAISPRHGAAAVVGLHRAGGHRHPGPGGDAEEPGTRPRRHRAPGASVRDLLLRHLGHHPAHCAHELRRRGHRPGAGGGHVRGSREAGPARLRAPLRVRRQLRAAHHRHGRGGHRDRVLRRMQHGGHGHGRAGLLLQEPRPHHPPFVAGRQPGYDHPVGPVEPHQPGAGRCLDRVGVVPFTAPRRG